MFNAFDYTTLKSWAAGITFLNWWTSNSSIGTVDTAITLFGLQQLTAPFAVIKPLARIGRHGFNLFVIAFWASNFGLQFGHAFFRFQRA